MNVSTYRRWYEITYCVPCPLSDSELQAYPYYLENSEIKAHTEQLNIPELIVMNSDQQVLAIELEMPAAVKAVRGFEGGKIESPHTITSGLLYHGDTNHD